MSIGRSRATIPLHRRQPRGQAVLEFAFLAPVLILLVFLIADVGRGLSIAISVEASARAGMLMAVTSQSSDVGLAVTQAERLTFPVSWGLVTGDGDPEGCAYPASAYWTSGVTGCFAIGQCAVARALDTLPATCAGQPTWNSRPLPGDLNDAVVVRVVVLQTALTPLANQAFAGGRIVLVQDAASYPAY